MDDGQRDSRVSGRKNLQVCVRLCGLVHRSRRALGGVEVGVVCWSIGLVAECANPMNSFVGDVVLLLQLLWTGRDVSVRLSVNRVFMKCLRSGRTRSGSANLRDTLALRFVLKTGKLTQEAHLG